MRLQPRSSEMHRPSHAGAHADKSSAKICAYAVIRNILYRNHQGQSHPCIQHRERSLVNSGRYSSHRLPPAIISTFHQSQQRSLWEASDRYRSEASQNPEYLNQFTNQGQPPPPRQFTEHLRTSIGPGSNRCNRGQPPHISPSGKRRLAPQALPPFLS